MEETKTRFSAWRTTRNLRPTLSLKYSEPKVSGVGFPQFLGNNERTASIGAGSNEPTRKGYRLKGGGTAVLVMVEGKGLHRLGSVVQIHYVLFLKGEEEAPGRNITVKSCSTFFTH